MDNKLDSAAFSFKEMEKAVAKKPFIKHFLSLPGTNPVALAICQIDHFRIVLMRDDSDTFMRIRSTKGPVIEHVSIDNAETIGRALFELVEYARAETDIHEG